MKDYYLFLSVVKTHCSLKSIEILNVIISENIDCACVFSNKFHHTPLLSSFFLFFLSIFTPSVILISTLPCIWLYFSCYTNIILFSNVELNLFWNFVSVHFFYFLESLLFFVVVFLLLYDTFQLILFTQVYW